jgi:hypothetical protein
VGSGGKAVKPAVADCPIGEAVPRLVIVSDAPAALTRLRIAVTPNTQLEVAMFDLLESF